MEPLFTVAISMILLGTKYSPVLILQKWHILIVSVQFTLLTLIPTVAGVIIASTNVFFLLSISLTLCFVVGAQLFPWRYLTISYLDSELSFLTPQASHR